MARLGPWRVSGFGRGVRLSERHPTEQRWPEIGILDDDIDRITFPHFRPVGWYWNGELHYFMTDQANTQDYPHPGELVAEALDAPPPPPAPE